MADASKRLSAAEIHFKKAQRPDVGKKPLPDYEIEAIATRKKIERLKALRLARDAAEAAVRPAAPARKKAARKVKARPADEGSATLSGWWKDQKEDGRST